MSPPLHTATVESVEPLSDWVHRVTLRIDDTVPFQFEPGQYISLHLQLQDGHEHLRHFSIASPSVGDNRIELCMTQSVTLAGTPDDALPHPGGRLHFSGPKGTFRLREPVDRDLVFIATGTGISPLRPMLHRALGLTSGRRKVTLLYGARTEADILYRTEFEAMGAETRSSFRFLPTLSRPHPGWSGLTGYVQRHLDQALAGRADLDVYVCGLKQMLEAVRPVLRDLGLDPGHVHFEKHT
jgi:CDP-4-dehydro-6-deoxyglucose reductase